MKNRWTIVLCAFFSIQLHAASRIDTIRIVSHDSVPLYMTIYTPSTYTPDSIYPVLYLLHGIHGNHHSWEENAHISLLADSLITDSLITPLVIVMPLCIVYDSIYATDIPHYGRNIRDYFRHIKKGEFEAYFPEIEAYITAHYSVKRYAIAGLSSGGRQAAMISNEGGFSVVGLFSPVLTNNQLPQENIGSIYWIRGGGGDLFYPRARRANRYLNAQQIPHDFRRTKGRHNWNTWRKHIEEFLLFAFASERVNSTIDRCESGLETN